MLKKDIALVVNSLMGGTLPAPDALDDAKLGQALRQAMSSGFKISIQGP